MEQAASANSLLWEATSPQKGASPIYILGTMHILCPADAHITPQVLDILGQVETVYLEADLTDMTDMVMSLKAMTMQDGTSLKDLLTEEQYQRVKEYFGKQNPLPFSMLERYKPMMLSSMVAEAQLPCDATNGMELLLLQECSKRNLPIKGLETLAYQAGLFDSIPYAVQARELMKAIDSPSTSSAGIDSLLGAYRRQDLQAIERLTLQEEESLQNLDLLLYGRNRKWAARLDTLSRQKPILVAVGAAHLPGKQGVLDLLKAKGYQLRPLKNEKGTIKQTL